jgi:3-oxoacyl-[acyl-carrier-protein] synthase II
MPKTRVFITSASLCTPIGSTLEEFSRRMFKGESGIVDIRGKIVPADFPIPYAGIISSLALPDLKDNSYQLEVKAQLDYLLETISPEMKKLESIDSLLFASHSHSAEWGSVISSFDRNYDWHQWAEQRGALHLIFKHLENISVRMNKNSLIGIQATCISGNTVIGRAFHGIREGLWSNALAGANEQRIRSWSLAPLSLLGALCTKEFEGGRASRPFDKQRSGFVKGEGTGILLLESEASIKKSRNRPLAEIVGFSQTSDAWRITDEREDMKGAIRAMEGAIQDAGIGHQQIDYINAHGTSTALNDKLETFAIKKVFGKRAYDIPVSSLKSQLGHLNISCGAIEIIASALMLKNQKISPTINYQIPDPDCDLDYVPNTARDAKIEYLLSNSFGFGGLNSCLVLRRVE